MIRSNHYEAAFEAYLQWHRLCYIAVDERRRSYLGEDFVKNLDFIVYGEGGSRLLIDVKGRRFPAGPAERPRRVWECWTKREDVSGLLRWCAQFGADYQGLFVFLYHLSNDEQPHGSLGDLWTWRGRRYFLRAVRLEAYEANMRRRSPKWETVYLPGADFRQLARPFHFFSHECAAPWTADCPF